MFGFLVCVVVRLLYGEIKKPRIAPGLFKFKTLLRDRVICAINTGYRIKLLHFWKRAKMPFVCFLLGQVANKFAARRE